MTEQPKDEPQTNFAAVLAELSASLGDADIYVYSGPVYDEEVHELLDQVENYATRPNIALILTTYGGSAEAAFRLCRCLKQLYKRFFLFIPGYCKSAGTLVATGADEIIMLRRAELGPLDVQLVKQDDLAGRSSGLDIADALRFLSTKSFEIFEEHFINILDRSGGAITTKTAGEIATSIAVGLVAPITQQLDPLRIGENQRAMNVAIEYGRLLGATPVSLRKLTMGYPTHGFVIDFEEVKKEKLFPCARQPNALEDAFFRLLKQGIIEKFEENLLREPSEDKLLAFLLNPTAQPSTSTTDANQPTRPNGDQPSPVAPAPAADNEPATASSAPHPVTDGEVAERHGDDNGQQTGPRGLSVEPIVRK
jgi:hypothetical protein